MSAHNEVSTFGTQPGNTSRDADRAVERGRMVAYIAAQGVTDARVLDAMRVVPREAFVDDWAVDLAYDDGPLPIGEEQTISRPYVIARMSAAAAVVPGDRVLEIGTGSGYGAAVLSLLAAEVDTVERIRILASKARRRLVELGYGNVRVHEGDGTLGWPERAPYDAIVVTAGGPRVPPALLDQLAIGGRLVMPVGCSPRSQRLIVFARTANDDYMQLTLDDVVSVPLVGAQGWPTPKPGPDAD